MKYLIAKVAFVQARDFVLKIHEHGELLEPVLLRLVVVVDLNNRHTKFNLSICNLLNPFSRVITVTW